MNEYNQKRKLLIVNPNQFGYSAGYNYYCKYLKDEFDIDFLYIDRGLVKVDEPGVQIIYRNSKKNRIKNLLSFILYAIKLSRQKDYDVIFCVYFRWVYLLGLFCKGGKKILDIRTGSLSDNKIIRFFYNRMNLFTSLFFDKITILSLHLSKLLILPNKKIFLLPLGASVLDGTPKRFDKIHLIYIGTFHKRHIEKTIEGFARFYSMHAGRVSLKYDIIGFSHIEDDVTKIKSTISKNNLNEIVLFHGRKNHQQLKEYMQNATIGVCFVPQTPYYDVQPPTKIFEYALSGLITIATDTTENRRVITDINGIICMDNEDSFCEALEIVYANLGKYDDSKIRHSLSEYNWEKIVKNILLPILT
ncbi:MAG TPA: glycosyltransferase [Bacteroidetes bacterium]|nr:glycosyltransferase [Bacteroidota bacterium]